MYSVIHIPLTSAGGLLRRLGARCQSPAQPIPTLLMRGSHDPIVNIKEATPHTHTHRCCAYSAHTHTAYRCGYCPQGRAGKVQLLDAARR